MDFDGLKMTLFYVPNNQITHIYWPYLGYLRASAVVRHCSIADDRLTIVRARYIVRGRCAEDTHRSSHRPSLWTTRMMGTHFFFFLNFFNFFFLFKHYYSLPFHTLQFHISSISLQLFSLIVSKMNPDDYDLSTSDGCRRALTRALFDAVNEAKAECLAQMQREQAEAEARVPRPIRRRTFVPREHDVPHERLFADYFAENPRWGPNIFHRRFRMSRDLFLRIVHTLEARDEYF